MSKMKTRRAVAKRFSLTATGKIKYQKAGNRHILTKKNRALKRENRKTAYVHASDRHNVMNCLPYQH